MVPSIENNSEAAGTMQVPSIKNNSEAAGTLQVPSVDKVPAGTPCRYLLRRKNLNL